MALNAEFLLSVLLELIGEIRALGVVTTDAGHHLSVPRIDDLGSDWMGEGPLVLMTAAAHRIAVALQHGRGIPAMGGVAGDALVTPLMAGGLATMAVSGVLMTAQADHALGSGQKHPVVAGMRAVAGNTTVAGGIVRQVAMDQQIILLHLRMARQADFRRNRRLPVMAGIAPLFEGGMQNLAHHGL